LRAKDGEGPKLDPVPLRSASRHVGIDIRFSILQKTPKDFDSLAFASGF